MRSIERDIYRTAAYFSYFRYPVSSFELWKWQLYPERMYTLGEILTSLELSARLRQELTCVNGFWGVGGERVVGGQVRERRRRYRNALKKFKKMRTVIRFVSRIPEVKGVAVCNSLAFSHTCSQSDIDLFILTEPGGVWRARLHAVTPMMLLSQRPGEAVVDPVDMSFFLSTDRLNISAFSIEDDDPYLAVWTRSLLPVYGDPLLWEAWSRENVWALSAAPKARLPRPVRALRQNAVRSLSAPVPEFAAKAAQMLKLPRDIRSRANEDSDIIMNENVLKFHRNDRRREIRRALNKAMRICEKS